MKPRNGGPESRAQNRCFVEGLDVGPQSGVDPGDARHPESSLVETIRPFLRSTVALHFAISAGEQGRRVLLVEGAARWCRTGRKAKDAGTASKSIGTPWHGVKVMQVRGGVEEGSPSADKAYRPSLSVPGTSIWSCSTAPRCCWISPGAARCLLMVASWSCIATRHAEQRSATRLKWPDRFRKT